MKGFFVHMALLVSAPFAVAQSLDSTQILREAEVRDFHKTKLDQGKLIIHIEANDLQSDLSQSLEMQSPILIKSYGAGMLGTLSIRGTGAAHSPILWHGISIQNAQNGQQDLSLINGFLFDDLQLSTGSQNGLSTGSILGGRLMLNQGKLKDGQQALLGFSYGSFSTRIFRLGFDHQKGKMSNRFRLIQSEAENDYWYINRMQKNQYGIMQNAYAQNFNVLNELDYALNSKWSTGLSIWFQHAHRNIPETLILLSQSNQEDLSARLVGHIRYQDSLQEFEITSAYLADHIYYKDELSRLYGNNHAFSSITQSRYRRNFKKFIWEGGLVYQHSIGKSNSYTEAKKDERYAIYTAFFGDMLKKKNLKWKADIRQSFWRLDPPLPSISLGLDWEFLPLQNFHIHATRIVRLPTLNDFYWNPGGNPELQAEEGFSGEFGYSIARKVGKNLIKARLQSYYSVIDNWIIWLPDGSFWKPQNLRKVHSRGIEWEFGAYRNYHHARLHINYGGSFTRASNEIALGPNDHTVGNQIIYVPYWKNYFGIEYTWKRLSLNYQHSFTGGRYTSSDNLEFLPAYSVANTEAKYLLQIKEHQINLGFGIKNLFNENYESILLRPMPGRYYQLSINYQFYKK